MRGVSGFLTWFLQDGAPWRRYPDPQPGPGSADEDVDGSSRHALITVSRVKGAPVFDADGHVCGQIRDLSVEKGTGRIVYALVSFSRLLGFDTRLLPLPWSLLHYDIDRDGYAVPLRTADIGDAPTLTDGDLEFFGAGDAAWRARLAAYYASFMGAPAL